MPDAIAALRSALGLDEIREELAQIKSQLTGATQSSPEWFTLRAACERKGCAYNTIKTRPDLQPGHGKPDGEIGGRRVWSRRTVATWIGQLDQPAPSRGKGRTA
jgi:hypothetical protein